MSQTNLRTAAAQTVAKVMNEEIARAERRVEERIRARVAAIPASKRHQHRDGDRTVEVIEAAAVAEAIGATIATDGAGA